MDEYRSDASLRHFYTRSAGLCRKAPVIGIPSNVNIYVQYDRPVDKINDNGMKFVHTGTSITPNMNSKIRSRKTIQAYMADN